MTAKFTLTCFKRKNDRSGDSFTNSYGSSRPEWDLLKEDAALKSLNCDFQLVEYDDIRSLQHGYDKKVDKPLYIDVRHMEDYDHSRVYCSMLLATHIAAFVIEFAKRFEVSTSVVIHVQPSQSLTSEKTSEGTSEAIIPPPQTSFVNSWKLPATIIGSFMFLALLAAGIVFFDWRRRRGSKLHAMSPFYLSEVPEKSTNVDFASIKSRSKKEPGLLDRGDLEAEI